MQKQYVLTGKITITGESNYKYQLVFTNKDGIISGHSLSWIPGEEQADKAHITGTIDEKKHTLTFRETGIVSQAHKSQEMCMVEATLDYKIKGKVQQYSGQFTGKDKNGKYCGSGSLTLQQNLKEKKQYSKPAENPSIAQVSDNAIIWHSDSCIINIWDYSSVDGDVATVLLNGKEVLSQYTITASKVRLHFPLKEGLNTLEIKAANAQSVLPVSARVIIMDGDKSYEFAASAAHGRDAINILKKK